MYSVNISRVSCIHMVFHGSLVLASSFFNQIPNPQFIVPPNPNPPPREKKNMDIPTATQRWDTIIDGEVNKPIGNYESWKCNSHWIGLRENLQETNGFLPLNIGLSCKFSHHPILWNRYHSILSWLKIYWRKPWSIWKRTSSFLSPFPIKGNPQK